MTIPDDVNLTGEGMSPEEWLDQARSPYGEPDTSAWNIDPILIASTDEDREMLDSLHVWYTRRFVSPPWFGPNAPRIWAMQMDGPVLTICYTAPLAGFEPIVFTDWRRALNPGLLWWPSRHIYPVLDHTGRARAVVVTDADGEYTDEVIR